MSRARSAAAQPWIYQFAHRLFAARMFREPPRRAASDKPLRSGWAGQNSLTDQRLGSHGTLPTFLAKAQKEGRARQALSRLGYRRVLATYSWQRKNAIGPEGFYGLTREGLSPSLEFVGGWLKEERKRIRTAVRSTFLAAMLSAIGAGFVFVMYLKMFK